jgi:futalosine hydrolase
VTRLLIVTAVAAERDAILTCLPAKSSAHVIAGGVGPAQSAAATGHALGGGGGYDLVLSAGIGGGFTPMTLGSIAVAASIVFADLGAETADGFASVAALGFGTDTYAVAPQLAVELTDRTGGNIGTILTVATVTGSTATRAELQRRHPDAVAEAMEGAGVAAAALAHGVAFAEVRAISNLVGPRDRGSWRIPEALAALGRAVAAIAVAPLGSWPDSGHSRKGALG